MLTTTDRQNLLTVSRSQTVVLYVCKHVNLLLSFLSVFPSANSFSSPPPFSLPLCLADSRVDQFVLFLKVETSLQPRFYISKPVLGSNYSDTIYGHFHYCFFFLCIYKFTCVTREVVSFIIKYLTRHFIY